MLSVDENGSRRLRNDSESDKFVGLPKPLDILGIPITPFESYLKVREAISKSIRNGVKVTCVAINPEKVQIAQKDKRLKQLLQSANMHICDGVGTALAARVLHGRRLPRITGVDLCIHLLEASEKEGWRVYLAGATNKVNQDAFDALTRQYPKLQIVGRCHGYHGDSAKIVADINGSRADLLFVAMGSPRQEEWIMRHRDQLQVPYCMGVGGTFDILSGNKRRAPSVVSKLGMEWLYRLVTEPQRWKRQARLPAFAWATLRSSFRPRNA